MGLKMDSFTLNGKSTIRAFPKGVIPRLLENGMALNDAVKYAIEAGLMLHENVKDNLVVTAGKILVADFLIGETRTGINYHAIGISTTAPAIGDTQLGTEAVRKAVTSIIRSSVSVIVSAFYTAAQCTYNIKEVGLFGNGATATANSGTLFSHAAQNEDNSAGLNDLTMEWELQIK